MDPSTFFFLLEEMEQLAQLPANVKRTFRIVHFRPPIPPLMTAIYTQDLGGLAEIAPWQFTDSQQPDVYDPALAAKRLREALRLEEIK